ncbi:MAG: apolipoprotein acyltransferase [Phycisphaerae bacterium]|nr:MAG: apolipoprotein acyltransferase [Phycisphaerae bacterium]
MDQKRTKKEDTTIDSRPTREGRTSIAVACCQLAEPIRDPKGTKRIEAMFRRAVDAKARLVVFPELFCVAERPHPKQGYAPFAQSLRQAARVACDWARRFGLWIVWGSVLERPRRPPRDKPHLVYNTSVVADPFGRIAAVYRKRRLFRAALPQGRYDEGRFFLAGRRAVRFTLDGWCFGMSVCFDLRFPSLYQTDRKNGAHAFVVPSAFTRQTGAAHWEVLVRARAIENQCYVIAPNMAGDDPYGRPRYGHSVIVDPWGRVLAQASEGKKDTVLTATLNIEKINEARQSVMMA